jgi:hypothetical protein
MELSEGLDRFGLAHDRRGGHWRARDVLPRPLSGRVDAAAGFRLDYP